jgi:hypothetical protein
MICDFFHIFFGGAPLHIADIVLLKSLRVAAAVRILTGGDGIVP